MDVDGQSRPKYTKTPNVLFDELFGLMKEAELRVTLALVRQTVGFHREQVSLSIADFQGLTGLSRQGVINGIEQGLKRKTVVRADDDCGGFLYSLALPETGSQRSRLVNFVDYHSGPELVNEVDQGSQRSRPEVVNLVDQYTPVLKKKEIGWLVGSNSSTRKRKKPTNQPEPNEAPLEPMQQLAFDLLCDSEVGVLREVARVLAKKLPAIDIFRAVDEWLPDRRQGKVKPALLKWRLDQVVPSDAPTVKLSAGFRESELFHRHRLPDELVADPERKQYNIDDGAAREPRKKYSV